MARIASSLDLGLLGGETGGRELARHQIALGDLDLLVLGVAGKLDHLHAVAQRPGDLVEHVGRADEHHPRQIERHREIVVAERRVLLGVEHLEQGGRRVAVEALPQLVHLVEHHHGVARAGLPDRLDHVAGQRPDIGAPMAPDLGLVMHAAELTAARICGPWRGRSTGRARSCRRQEGRRNTGSGSCPRASACAPRDIRGCAA